MHAFSMLKILKAESVLHGGSLGMVLYIPHELHSERVSGANILGRWRCPFEARPLREEFQYSQGCSDGKSDGHPASRDARSPT